MAEIMLECGRCDGSGEITNKTIAFGTFGIAWILGAATEDCYLCDGKGYRCIEVDNGK